MKFTYIDTIDFASLEVRLNNKLYFDPKNNKFYKVWDEDAVLWERNIGPLFLQAINKDFYEGLAKIEDVLITDTGKCVGYSMRKQRCPIWEEPQGKLHGDIKRHKNKHDFSIFNNTEEQNEKYQFFYRFLLLKAAVTGIFFYDLVQSNICDTGNGYGIIDLESVAHIRDLYKIPAYHRECMPEDYYARLQEIYTEKIGISNTGIDMPVLKRAFSMSTGGMDRKPYYSTVVNGQYLDGEREWKLRWDKFKDLSWKGKKVLDLGTCMGMVPAYLLKFREIASATGIDINPVHVEATHLIRQAFRIPEEKFRVIEMDLHKCDYEGILGYEYDCVFCLSFLRWIKDKERLLKYLSHFNEVVFEAHDLDGDAVETFKQIGFTKCVELGSSRIGKSFDAENKRFMYHFSK